MNRRKTVQDKFAAATTNQSNNEWGALGGIAGSGYAEFPLELYIF